MTDKEIIIDGVDVSKCDRLIVNQLYGYVCNCEEDTHIISSCKNRHNCYYKQLARKTQECEQKEKRNAALFLMSNRYRKALEEIEKYTREQFCDNCEDMGSTEYNCHCEYCEYQEYFDIIAKAKDGK